MEDFFKDSPKVFGMAFPICITHCLFGYFFLICPSIFVCNGSTDFTWFFVIPPTCISLQVHAPQDSQLKEEPNLIKIESTNANKLKDLNHLQWVMTFKYQTKSHFNSMLLSKNSILIHEQINLYDLMMFVYKVGNQPNCFGILRMLLILDRWPVNAWFTLV